MPETNLYVNAENEHIPGLITHWFGNYGLQDLMDAVHILRMAGNRLKSQVSQAAICPDVNLIRHTSMGSQLIFTSDQRDSTPRG